MSSDREREMQIGSLLEVAAEAMPTTEEEVEDIVADSIGRARSRRAKAVRSKGSRP